MRKTKHGTSSRSRIVPAMRVVEARQTYGAWRSVEVTAKVATDTMDDPALVSIHYTAKPGDPRSEDVAGLEVRLNDLGPLLAALTEVHEQLTRSTTATLEGDRP